MSREVHVRFCERLGGRFPGATRLVVTGASKEVLETRVLPAVRTFLAARGLELSEEKTRITHITEGFDFLGQNVRKYGNKLLIKPARKSIKSLLDRIRKIIKVSATVTQKVLIKRLNPVIRGWANYHRHIVAKAAFSSIDSHIWQLLWKWARRRHPTKGARWVKKRYFHQAETRSWDFAVKSALGLDIRTCTLFRAATIPIKRHIKIRGAAHPLDPAWETYLARRQTTKCSAKLLGATS